MQGDRRGGAPTLIIDTCLAACQTAVVRGDATVASASEPMERGHQERLAPMVAEVVAAAGVSFAEIARIAVTVGPGSFTGLRVGVAFAKGLRLATGAALAALEVLPALAEDAGHDCVAAAVDARQGRVHVQVFEAGSPLGPPATLSIDEAAAWLGAQGCLALTGPGAPLLAPHLTAARLVLAPFPSIGALAALARRAPDAADVRPLYLRAPDIRTKGA